MQREPVFGPNAKAFAIQLIVGLIAAFTIGPVVGRAVADTGCKFIYLCSPEAAKRIHGSEHPQSQP